MKITIADFLLQKAEPIKKIPYELVNFSFSNPIDDPESDFYKDELVFSDKTRKEEKVLQKIVFYSVYYWIFFSKKILQDSSNRGSDIEFDLNSEDVYGQFQNLNLKFWEVSRRQNLESGAIDLEAWKPKAFESMRKSYEDEIKKHIKEYFSFNEELKKEFIEYFSAERKTDSKFLNSFGQKCVQLIEKGKCRDDYFPFCLNQILLFLDNKNLLPTADECIKNLATYCACVSNEDIFFKIINSSLMHRIFVQCKCFTAIARGAIPSCEFSDKENKELEYRFLSYEQILSCLKLDEQFRIHRYFKDSFEDELDEFVQIGFSKEYDKLPEKCAEEDAEKKFKSAWKILGAKIDSYPSFAYCFFQMSKYLDSSFLKEFFVQRNQSSFKSEFERYVRICAESEIPISSSNRFIGSEIFSQNDEKKLEKERTDYKNRKKLLVMMLCFAVWELFSGCQQKFGEDEKREQFHIRFYKLFMSRNIQETQFVKDLFSDLFVFILDDEKFAEKCTVDFNDTESLVHLLFGLSRFHKSREQSIVYLLNFVREIQKLKYNCVPNGPFKIDESKRIENHKKLQEDIDFGFGVSFQEKVSPLNLYDGNLAFSRNMKIKTFSETDKVFDSKGNEDVSLTNKNHLSNHYLYSDRNVRVHFSNPVVIEKLLNQKNPSVLIKALKDIQEYLSNQNDSLAVKFLQDDFARIKKKLSEACHISDADFFSSYFSDESAIVVYDEQIKALLVSDTAFVHELDSFVRIMFGFNIIFKEYDLKIVFYLLFQIFSFVS